jgi:hypothetical protein
MVQAGGALQLVVWLAYTAVVAGFHGFIVPRFVTGGGRGVWPSAREGSGAHVPLCGEASGVPLCGATKGGADWAGGECKQSLLVSKLVREGFLKQAVRLLPGVQRPSPALLRSVVITCMNKNDLPAALAVLRMPNVPASIHLYSLTLKICHRLNRWPEVRVVVCVDRIRPLAITLRAIIADLPSPSCNSGSDFTTGDAEPRVGTGRGGVHVRDGLLWEGGAVGCGAQPPD